MRNVTQAQIDYIRQLQYERIVPHEMVSTMRKLWDMGQFDYNSASGYIQTMLSMPYNEKNYKFMNSYVGYHKLHNEIYRVYRSNNDFMYVKRLERNNDKVKFISVSRKIMSEFGSHTKMRYDDSVQFENYVRDMGAIR